MNESEKQELADLRFTVTALARGQFHNHLRRLRTIQGVDLSRYIVWLETIVGLPDEPISARPWSGGSPSMPAHGLADMTFQELFKTPLHWPKEDNRSIAIVLLELFDSSVEPERWDDVLRQIKLT